MSKTLLRPPVPDDALRIVALAKQFSAANPSASKSALNDIERLSTIVPNLISMSSGDIIVAEQNATVIGVTVFSVVPSLVHAGRPTLFVDLLVVDEFHRRQGVGSCLVEHLVRKSAELNAYKLLLVSREDNLAAQALYRKFSFSVNGLGLAKYLA